MELKIDFDRKKRYVEKISHARERLFNLEEWISDKEKKSVLASEKAFQEAAEVLIDLFAMLVADLKLNVSDDYSNIEKVVSIEIITKEEGEICKETNGLRNRVVHEYNGFDENKFIESTEEILPKLYLILDKIENFVTNGTRNKKNNK